MYICKNCGKEFTEKYSKWSDGNFCCKSCAKSYAGNIKKEEIKHKLKERLFGKNILKDGTVIDYYKIYMDNPKICPICGNIIPYERRMRKTCSNECGRQLSIINYKKACQVSHKVGGYRKGSGLSKHGYYKGIYCDSTYELAYLIYCLDHNIDIQRCNESFEYEYNGKKHKYHPDFVVNGELIEIKGYNTDLVEVKANAVNKPYKLLFREDLQECFKYIAKTYNKNFRDNWNNFHELYDSNLGV